MGLGVKVATLPVIALGAGIGVDYALYVLSVMLAQLRAGATLKDAYAEPLRFTGEVVMLTGITPDRNPHAGSRTQSPGARSTMSASAK